MRKFPIIATGRAKWLLALLPFTWLPCKTQPLQLSEPWYRVPGYSHCAEEAQLPCAGATPIDRLDRTGGRFFWQGNFEIKQTTQLVGDFKNSSEIGRFHHNIFDDQSRLIAEAAGACRISRLLPQASASYGLPGYPRRSPTS